MKERPTIICLCGSGRFKATFDHVECEETLLGNIVLTIGCNCHDAERESEFSHHKTALDELHKHKIDLADEVLILNVDGYIGESTRSEIEYASRINKPIRFLEYENKNRKE